MGKQGESGGQTRMPPGDFGTHAGGKNNRLLKEHLADVRDDKSAKQITVDERDSIRRLIEARGEAFAAECLGIKHNTLARVLAALPVQRGTVALVRQGMKSNAKEFK